MPSWLGTRTATIVIFCLLVFVPLALSLIVGRLPPDGCQLGFGSTGC